MEAVSDNLPSRAVDGDRDALVELLKRHGPGARRGLRGRIPKRWLAVLSEDDVMQQTYADAVGSLHEFRSGGEASFAKWLSVTARRNLRDAVRMLEAEKRGGNRRRAWAPGTDESVVALYESLTGPGTTPSRHAARVEVRQALEDAIGQLPEVYARVVGMCDLKGRSVREVAATLGRSPGAVHMLRTRAHERLHAIMGRTSRFFGDSA